MEPDEVYNLGRNLMLQLVSKVRYTADVDGVGTLRLLEAVRFLGLEKKTKFYQASTSELYGLFKRLHKKRQHLFTHDLLMLWLNYIHIGYVLTIVSHTVCLHAMVYYLIMRAHVEEKHLLHVRLRVG